MKSDLESSWNILSEKLNSWLEAGIGHLPNFAVAVVVILCFVLIGKLSQKVLRRVLAKTSDNEAVNGLLETLVYVVFLFFGLFTALGVMNLDKTLTSLLAGAGVIGLALGFAFQEIAANFISGVMIAFRKPYKIGDIVEVIDYMGKVTKIHLRTTSVTTFSGLEVIIPNKEMFTKPLINYTSTPQRRVDIEVGVSYGDDLEKVERLTVKAIEGLEIRVKDKPVELFYKEFGSSSINFQLRFWVEYPGQLDYLRAMHQAIKVIKKTFDENDITIPFPIRTLDFGIKGGLGLEEPLKAVGFKAAAAKKLQPDNP